MSSFRCLLFAVTVFVRTIEHLSRDLRLIRFFFGRVGFQKYIELPRLVSLHNILVELSVLIYDSSWSISLYSQLVTWLNHCDFACEISCFGVWRPLCASFFPYGRTFQGKISSTQHSCVKRVSTCTNLAFILLAITSLRYIIVLHEI